MHPRHLRESVPAPSASTPARSTRPPRTRALLSLASLTLAVAAPVCADRWAAPALIDARAPLEIGRAAYVETLSELYAPVAFAGKLELVIVDLANPAQPVDRTVDLWPAAISSLGAAGYVAPDNRLGGAFVDAASSDLVFWSCAPPCLSVVTTLVDSSRNWSDADSDVAGHDFVAGGVDAATGEYRIFDSTDGGLTFDLLRQLSTAGVLRSSQGGERARLVVDPQASAASGAFHCVFHERPAAGQATEKRLDCAWGTTPAFDEPVATDVPNPTGSADRFVESSCAALPFAAGVVACIFDRRADATVRAVIVDFVGGLARERNLGPMPTGSATPRYSALQVHEFDDVLDKIELVAGGGAGQPARNWSWAPGSALPDSMRSSTLPTSTAGPLAAGLGRDCAEPSSCRRFLAGLYGDNGLRLTLKAIPLFDDGFEPASTGRWTAVTP